MRYFYMNRMEDYYILLKLCNIDFIGRIGQKENLLNQIIDEIGYQNLILEAVFCIYS